MPRRKDITPWTGSSNGQPGTGDFELFFAGRRRMLSPMPNTPILSPDPVSGHLATDGGPVYVETERNLDRVGTGAVVEPWNAASALLFLVVVVVWLVRLRGRYRKHPFLTCCLPLLAAGGVGGVVYHAFR